MAEASGNPFRDGRENLRETAKWMVSGAVGAASLIVGSSTISQLGSMDPASLRFKVAIGTLLLAAGLCWVPFIRAVEVLRSDLHALKTFMAARDGDLKDSVDAVSKLLGTLPEGGTFREWVAAYPAAHAQAAAITDPTQRGRTVADLEGRFQTGREACISQLVSIRFDRLVESIRWPGGGILVLFVVFTWAANPPKDAFKVFDRPYVEDLTPARIARLRAARIDPGCLGTGARLIAVGSPDDGPQTAILSPPLAGGACPPRKVTLSGGKIVTVE